MAKEKSKNIDIILTRATVISGAIVRPGKAPITVSEADAKNLMQRERAVLATEENIAAADDGDDGGDDGGDGEKRLSEHTVPELKARAAELEIDGADGMKKAELVAAIEAAEADE